MFKEVQERYEQEIKELKRKALFWTKMSLVLGSAGITYSSVFLVWGIIHNKPATIVIQSICIAVNIYVFITGWKRIK